MLGLRGWHVFASRDSHVTCTNDQILTFKGIKVESTYASLTRVCAK